MGVLNEKRCKKVKRSKSKSKSKNQKLKYNIIFI